MYPPRTVCSVSVPITVTPGALHDTAVVQGTRSRRALPGAALDRGPGRARGEAREVQGRDLRNVLNATTTLHAKHS